MRPKARTGSSLANATVGRTAGERVRRLVRFVRGCLRVKLGPLAGEDTPDDRGVTIQTPSLWPRVAAARVTRSRQSYIYRSARILASLLGNILGPRELVGWRCCERTGAPVLVVAKDWVRGLGAPRPVVACPCRSELLDELDARARGEVQAPLE